ncbi:MAG: NFACT family protein [Oscillospiraceae bacterium]|nr:NFACT family protein [Oscillospiraceae bacterium]
MPVDAFAVSALRLELSEALEGGRIDKIHMPSKNEVHILGRAVRGSFRLLLSAHTQRPRAHLTAIARENPQTPPMFAMLLRKHLTNGRFVEVFQPHLERVLHFTIEAADEMGFISLKKLVIEMIGRHSNIILIDAEGRIVDALRKVDPEQSPDRPVLPGLFYRDPPGQGKTDPTTVSEEDFRALYRKKPPEMPTNEWLGSTFTAFPPLLCRDLSNSSTDCDTLYSRFCNLLLYVKDNTYTQQLIKKKTDFFCLPLQTVEQEEWNGTISQLMDNLYTSRDQSEHIGQRASALNKKAKSTRDKLVKKTGLLRQELHDAQNREHLRQKADILMANLHQAERGAESVTFEDFYNDGNFITIKLDASKTQQQNAAALYKSYAKAKNAEAALTKQIEQAERDAEYWESVLDQLSRVSNERDIEEIREEIAPSRQHRVKPAKISQPMRFRSSDGFVFRAGRNNRQNDLLTMKMASKNDIWLHTQKIPGCHVIVQTDGIEPSEQTLYEAACVAAWFSAAKISPKVPVDYTSVKYVKKPPSARPGMVIYDKFKTIMAEPNEELVERLRID